MDNSHSLDIASDYGRGVVNGSIDVCRYTRLAVERHYRDLEEGAGRGLYFSEPAAQRILDWYAYLRHSKGEWAGQPFVLEPWQQFWLSVQFGWKREVDDLRRFRTAYYEMPRKNDKSTFAAGEGYYMLIADGEGGAEIYSAATKRDQAKIVFSEAKNQVKASPALAARVGVYSNNLHVLDTHSKYEPLGADGDSMDGLNVHCAIVDELHAHKTSAVVVTGTNATGG